MPFQWGQRIKMLTWFEGMDSPQTDSGQILSVMDSEKLLVEMDQGSIITWIVDSRNTVVIQERGVTNKD